MPVSLSLPFSLDGLSRAEERRPAGVSKVFTHLRCRDLPINHCNSACPVPSRAIRVRICISDYTGREGGNDLPRMGKGARAGEQGDRMHKYVTSHRCFAFPSNWPLESRFHRLHTASGNQISPGSLSLFSLSLGTAHAFLRDR